MLHDAAGNVLVSQVVKLKPGQATFLDYAVDLRTTPLERVGITPVRSSGSRARAHSAHGRSVRQRDGSDGLSRRPVSPRLSFVKGQLVEPR